MNPKQERKKNMEVKGIDVSSHQGVIDWNKVKAAGIRFAIIRVGYGDLLSYPKQLDSQFRANVEGAQKAGVDIGFYLFSYAGTEEMARREAQGLKQAIAGMKPEMCIRDRRCRMSANIRISAGKFILIYQIRPALYLMWSQGWTVLLCSRQKAA